MPSQRTRLIVAGLAVVALSLAGCPKHALVKEMRQARVVVVPPKEVEIRGSAEAGSHHQPLQGYDPFTYPELFASLAVDQFRGAPTRWDTVGVIPDEDFYGVVHTSDPDGDPAGTLPSIPGDGGDFVAVFRYAEFYYRVEAKPVWTKVGGSAGGQIVMARAVVLTVDLQLVIHDGTSGEPIESFDAEYTVEVPEIQSRPLGAKAFYRGTAGALREMCQNLARSR